jgi:hypothetical protein
MDLDLLGVTTSSISAIQPMRPRSGGRRPPPEPDRAAVTDQIERQIAQRDVDKFAEMLRKKPGK